MLLVRFLAKRVAILAVVGAVIALFSPGVTASVGVVLGAFTALYKIRLFGSFLDNITQKEAKIGKKSFVFQIFSQFLIFVLLIVAVLTDVRFFFGVASGLLLTPLFICVNAVTEKANITHNGWGIKEGEVIWKK